MRIRLLPLPLDSVLSDADATDLAGAPHMGPAVGLLVQPDDVDHPDLADRVRTQDSPSSGSDPVEDGRRRAAGN